MILSTTPSTPTDAGELAAGPVMRIAIVLPGAGVSGGIRSPVRFAAGLRERGHDVTIYYRRPVRSFRERLRNWYIATRHGGAVNWLATFPGRKVAYDELSGDLVGRHDLVIAVGPIAAAQVAKLPDACGIKVKHVHGSAQDRNIVLAAWRHPWPKIVVANHLKRMVEADGRGKVVAVIPNGVDREEYFADGDESERRGVGTIWHQAAVKGPEVILAVLARIREVHPQVPLLVFSHQPRPTGLPAGTQYVRYPSVEAARRLYSRCRVWLCASRSEGLGMPILEAMACGCAVVSTDCGGPADLIDDGENGYLVPVDAQDAIVDRIHRLLTEDALRRRIVAGATARLDRYGWPTVVAEFEKALQSILRAVRQSDAVAPADIAQVHR